MNPVLRLRDRLLKIPIMLEVAIRDETIKNRKYIAELNREQLQEGKKADGSDMPDYIKDSKQPSAPGKITLFQHGDFHGGIDSLFNDEGFEPVGLDDKTWFLVKKYGKILGLSPASKAKLLAKLKPGIIDRVKTQLHEKA